MKRGICCWSRSLLKLPASRPAGRFHAVIWPAMLMAAGPRAAAQGVRPRLAARRRREDEQDQADRHRAERDHRRLRLRRVPLLLPAGDPVRPGRVVLLGGHGGALQGRARRPVRQPRVAADLDGRPLPRRRAARRRSTSRRSRRRSATARRRRPRRPSTASTCRARSARRWTFVARSTTTSPSRSRGSSPRTTADAADLDRVLYATAEALRAVAVLLNPVMPKASATLWTRSAPRRRSGRCPTQRVQDAGALGPAARRARRSPRASRCSRASRSPTRHDRR